MHIASGIRKSKVALFALTLLLPAAALAHGGGGTVLQAPDNGSTVGRAVTLEGTTAFGCTLGVTIDGTLTYPDAGQTDKEGAFKAELDLSGQPVVDQEGRRQGLAPGQHTFTVQPKDCEEAAEHTSTTISLIVVDETSEEAEGFPWQPFVVGGGLLVLVGLACVGLTNRPKKRKRK